MEEKYTTCRVEHRDYVPYGYIAIEFCNVKFMGKDKRKYEKEWNNIEFKKLNQREEEIKEINEKLKTINEEIKTLLDLENNIEEEIKEMRKKLSIFARLFKGDTEEIKDKKNVLKLLIYAIDCKINKYNELIALKNNLDEDKFYSQSELMCKIERYLEDNGFRIINSNQSGGECKTQTDIWQKEYY